jgi:hypothetical protein
VLGSGYFFTNRSIEAMNPGLQATSMGRGFAAWVSTTLTWSSLGLGARSIRRLNDPTQ